ncbi:MAG: hypothetical protein IJ223_01825 [Clostridia bacterium]|nr:hypothetical protein [Clostridia bacterium]
MAMLLTLVPSAHAEVLPEGITYRKEGSEETYTVKEESIALSEKILELRRKLIQEGRLLQMTTQIEEYSNGTRDKKVILCASTEKVEVKPFEVIIYTTDSEAFADETQNALTHEIKNRFFLISRYQKDVDRFVVILNRQLVN